jgi:hypothetical protein
VKKCKEILKTPELPNPNPRLQNLIPAEGVLHLSSLRKTKEPRHTSFINITLQVSSGKVTELITELMFDGLDILCAKDKIVCFVYQKDFEQQARSSWICQQNFR